jgi:uncharacterized protein
MRKANVSAFVLAGLLLCAHPASAQTTAPAPTPPADAVAAARDLVSTMNLSAQFRAILPSLMQALKPAIVQDRPDAARDFDAALPAVLDAILARTNEINDIYANIYARNFSATELRDIAAFYRTESGQKLLAKLPIVTNEGLAAGQRFGQSLAFDLQQRMQEALRKKGNNN